MNERLRIPLVLASAVVGTALVLTPARAQQTPRPNILVIFGDDIGQSNISAYTHGLVGYKTPNIDRIGREGMMFTDYYAENSCTAGRSSFITGQTPKRTGYQKLVFPARQLEFRIAISLSHKHSSHLDTQPVSSARIISVTATNFCQPDTASMSSSAIFIISTLKKSPSGPTGRRTIKIF